MSKTKWYTKPIRRCELKLRAKRRGSVAILVALALVLSLGIVAVPMAGTAEAQDGTYLGTPPTIDGDLSEWEAAGTQYIYTDGCLGEEQIGTGKLYMAFDDDNFYLAYKLEDAGAGDDYLYAFNGGFWFPDASAYNSSDPLPSEFVLTDAVLELRQSWSGVRGAGAVYGEWMIEIVSNNAARIIRLGSMQATSGQVTNLDSYAGSYDGEDPFPGSYITDGVSKDLWVLTGFSAFDPYFGQYSVHPGEVWVDDGFDSSTPGWGETHFATIQDGIDAVAGSTVHVAAGTYTEHVTIDKSLALQGAGASQTTIDVSGLLIQNPHVAVEVQNGVNNVVVDGFTIIGVPAFHHSDDSVIRCGGSSGTNNDITISNNVIDGYVGILFKNGDSFTVQQNDITFNKNAIVIQSGCTNVDISDNTMTGGTSMDIDPYGIYITSTTGSITGNTIENVIGPDDRGKGISGSSNHDLVIDDNVINNTGYDGISFWSNTHHVTISNNTLSNNAQTYTKGGGITIKGDDLTIINNNITGSGHDGVIIDTHELASVRIDINYNNIWGNADYGVSVKHAGEIVDATNNWWGDASGPGGVGFGTGDAVSDNVDYDPWLDAPAPDGKSISFVGAKQDTVTDGTLDAKAEAGTEVVVDGSATVTAAKYSDNPGSDFSGDIGKYIDVHIDSDEDVTELEIRLYYTDAEIATLGLDELSLSLKWWDGTKWVTCSPDSGVNTTDIDGYSGYMWAKVRATDTIPLLSALVGAPFGASGEPVAEPAAEELEYGDAPDLPYPSFLLSDGARHLPTTTEILGLASTPDSKNFETDANVPDLDLLDDGLVTTTITADNTAETVTFEVTDFMAPSDDLRVNILIDLNRDGDWNDVVGGQSEHVVQNQLLSPSAPEQVLLSSPFSTVGATPGATWLRMTLTRHDILNLPWDGTMTGYAPMTPFEFGETEDWEITIEAPPPPPPVGVGGEAYPVNKLAILAPWIALAAAIIAGATIFIRRRRAEG